MLCEQDLCPELKKLDLPYIQGHENNMAARVGAGAAKLHLIGLDLAM